MLSYDLDSVNDCLPDNPEQADSDICSTLRNIRKNNSNKIAIAYLNINFIRNKFNFLADIIKRNLDILMISDSKLDNFFPDGQFFLI